MRGTHSAVAVLMLLGVACHRQSPLADRKVDADIKETVVAVLRDSTGREVARATLIERSEGVVISIEGSGLPPGEHGFHIHDAGECHPPDFKSAAGHFNPEGKEHGFENPRGSHAGDLPNLAVGDDGKVKTQRLARGVTLSGTGKTSLLKPGGTSLVIHEKPDDYKTDPDGSAGKRIACGAIQVEHPAR